MPDITLANGNNIYALYEGGLTVLSKADLSVINTYSLSFTGTPLKALWDSTTSRLVFNTVDKLYSCNADGTDLQSVDNLGSFAVSGGVWRGELDTTYNITKLNTTTLVEGVSIETALATDTTPITSFPLGNYIYQLVQSATDNNVKLVRVDKTAETYTATVLTGIAINTITGCYPVFADNVYYIIIHTTDGTVWKYNTNTEQLTQDASNIVVNNLNSDPSGRILKEIE